jgi:hypothetical protein
MIIWYTYVGKRPVPGDLKAMMEKGSKGPKPSSAAPPQRLWLTTLDPPFDPSDSDSSQLRIDMLT